MLKLNNDQCFISAVALVSTMTGSTTYSSGIHHLPSSTKFYQLTHQEQEISHLGGSTFLFHTYMFDITNLQQVIKYNNNPLDGVQSSGQITELQKSHYLEMKDL